jgi:hypothetical protein
VPPFLFVRYHVHVNAHLGLICKNWRFGTEQSMASDLNNPPAPRDGDYYQLDRRLTILETRFDTILPTLATKADLAELKAELTGNFHSEIDKLSRWMLALTVSMVCGFGGIIVAMLRH